MTDTISVRTLNPTGQLIGGRWEAGVGTQLQSICPADNSVVYDGQEASTAQVDQAVQAARDAIEAWAALPADDRIEFVTKHASVIEEKKHELAELISAETGKPLWEARTEAGAVVGKSALSIDAFRTRRDTTSFDMNGMQAVTRYKPYGVMGVLGPFNFPAHLPNGHIVPALIAGNTVVYKPSEQTPAVGQWMAQKWEEVGLPPGVVNMVQGGREAGVHLAGHRQLDGLLFTGSSHAGKALHRIYGEQPEKMLALEMGGNNPLIVHEASDHLAAAYITVNSAYITAGQRCTCARRLIVVEGKGTDTFLDTLVETIGKVKVAPFTETPEPFTGTVISASQGQRLLDDQEKLWAAGGRSLVEMAALNGNSALLSLGLVDVTEIQDRSDEEMFGPILSVIRVKDFDAAIKEANNTAYGLSAGLISCKPELYQQFIRRIRAGIVNWNRQTTGASGKLPFGGCGLSGNHRPSAYFAADYCSYPVASLESAELTLPEQIAPGISITK